MIDDSGSAERALHAVDITNHNQSSARSTVAKSSKMMKVCLISTLLVSTLGGAVAFTSRVGGPRPTAVGSTAHMPKARALDTTLFSSSTQNDDVSSDGVIVQKRRAFLANFAAASLLPLFTVANPSSASANEKGPIVYGSDDIMSKKDHGTTAASVQEDLRYGVSRKLADKICSFNRVFAENGGYFQGSSTFEKDVRNIVASTNGPVTFYDSVSGKPLFKAPINRSVDDFIAESKVHGWPSFRDEEGESV